MLVYVWCILLCLCTNACVVCMYMYVRVIYNLCVFICFFCNIKHFTSSCWYHPPFFNAQGGCFILPFGKDTNWSLLTENWTHCIAWGHRKEVQGPLEHLGVMLHPPALSIHLCVLPSEPVQSRVDYGGHPPTYNPEHLLWGHTEAPSQECAPRAGIPLQVEYVLSTFKPLDLDHGNPSPQNEIRHCWY